MMPEARSDGSEDTVVKLSMIAVALVCAVVALLPEAASPPPVNAAPYQTGAYHIISPLSGERYVTSPPRFHNGCPAEPLYDSISFDNGVCDPAGITPGHWSMDLQIPEDSPVFIDIQPGAIDGVAAGSTYRVVAGDVHDWGCGANEND